ncbi:MAG TPA: ADP-ribosylglycohydrolase family protein, partial [Clostridia bacterium]
IHCWLGNQNNFEKGVLEIIKCGGDTDTTAAILGGIIGAKVCREGIPQSWISNVCIWPYGARYYEDIGSCLYDKVFMNADCMIDEVPVLLIILRNLLFGIVILIHMLRRIMPPY